MDNLLSGPEVRASADESEKTKPEFINIKICLMIVKIPVYFEVVDKLTPQEIEASKTFVLGLLPQTIKRLLKTQDGIMILTNGQASYHFKVLEPHEVLKKISRGEIEDERI